LDWYYRNAMFTVFPSLAEGWGLPVAESMCYGKVCIASNVDSIPEIAGDLIPYFDPRDPDQIYKLVKQYITDSGLRSRAEKRIRSHYRPHSWDTTAEELISICNNSRHNVKA
jgi:glycosyltransferase involved in cell wall biosynthesis